MSPSAAVFTAASLTEFRSQIDSAILGKIKPLFHNLNF